jgi:hypothetical protein
LGPRHIREYQAELFQKRKVSAALRFFYIKTLKKAWSIRKRPIASQRSSARKKSRDSSMPLALLSIELY